MAKGQDPQSRSGGVLNGVAECHIIYQGCNYGDWEGVGRDWSADWRVLYRYKLKTGN